MNNRAVKIYIMITFVIYWIGSFFTHLGFNEIMTRKLFLAHVFLSVSFVYIISYFTNRIWIATLKDKISKTISPFSCKTKTEVNTHYCESIKNLKLRTSELKTFRFLGSTLSVIVLPIIIWAFFVNRELGILFALLYSLPLLSILIDIVVNQTTNNKLNIRSPAAETASVFGFIHFILIFSTYFYFDVSHSIEINELPEKITLKKGSNFSEIEAKILRKLKECNNKEAENQDLISLCAHLQNKTISFHFKKGLFENYSIRDGKDLIVVD